MMDVEAAKMAVTRSKSPAIKKFAVGAVKEHTAQALALKMAVAAGGLGGVKMATQLDSRRQGLIDNLKHASADDFDARFLDQMAAAHREESELMKTYAKTGSNEALKALAEKTIPTVDQHMAILQALDHANADHDAPGGGPNGKANGTP